MIAKWKIAIEIIKYTEITANGTKITESFEQKLKQRWLQAVGQSRLIFKEKGTVIFSDNK